MSNPSNWPKLSLLLRTINSSVDRLLAPSPYRAATILRRTVGIVLLLKVAAEFKDVLEIYGDRGLIRWVISESLLTGWSPCMSRLSSLLIHFGVSKGSCVYLIFAMHAVALLGMIGSWIPRAFAAVAWITYITLLCSTSLSSYGLHVFCTIALFYCVLLPDDRGQPAQITARASRDSASSGLLFRLLQIHLCLVYFTSGIEKARGIQWWNGEAIWRALMQRQFQIFDISWMASAPWLAVVICWGTVALEIGYPVLVCRRQTRTAGVIAAVSLHLMIAICLGL